MLLTNSARHAVPTMTEFADPVLRKTVVELAGRKESANYSGVYQMRPKMACGMQRVASSTLIRISHSAHRISYFAISPFRHSPRHSKPQNQIQPRIGRSEILGEAQPPFPSGPCTTEPAELA